MSQRASGVTQVGGYHHEPGKAFAKRQQIRAERRTGKRLLDDAPKRRAFRGVP